MTCDLSSSFRFLGLLLVVLEVVLWVPGEGHMIDRSYGKLLWFLLNP